MLIYLGDLYFVAGIWFQIGETHAVYGKNVSGAPCISSFAQSESVQRRSWNTELDALSGPTPWLIVDFCHRHTRQDNGELS